MARTAKKTIYEQIGEVDRQIASTEERLIALKEQKKKLENERDQYEMEKLFTKMKEQGLTFDEAMSALTK